MFEVDGVYANRKGTYKILEINEPKMTVRYEDGTQAELNVHIQERIWENILAEREAQAAARSARKARWGTTNETRHFIKVVSLPPGEDFIFPGWEERVVMLPSKADSITIKKGDRLIYYAQEAQTFFAVVTITDEAFVDNPKKYTYTLDVDEAQFFPVDVDADTGKLEKGVTFDSVELESYPDFGQQTPSPETFYPISEDDFELLAEALTEVSEEDEGDYEDDEDYDYEDE